MSTYLFTWNPQNWPWPNRNEELAAFAKDGLITLPWSCSAHRQVRAELDNGICPSALLFRSGNHREQQGIIGWGQINDQPFEAPHYDDVRVQKGDLLWYVKIQFQGLVENTVIARGTCEQLAPRTFTQLPMNSGRRIIQADADVVWDMIK